MAKCYIRLDKNKNIIHNFGAKFEQPKKNDILVEDTPGRHFNNELIPKGLKDDNDKWNYKYVSKKIIEQTDDEKWAQKEKSEKEKEVLIATEMRKILRELAIQKLKDDGKLNAKGNLVKLS